MEANGKVGSQAEWRFRSGRLIVPSTGRSGEGPPFVQARKCRSHWHTRARRTVRSPDARLKLLIVPPDSLKASSRLHRAARAMLSACDAPARSSWLRVSPSPSSAFCSASISATLSSVIGVLSAQVAVRKLHLSRRPRWPPQSPPKRARKLHLVQGRCPEISTLIGS